MGCHSLLQEIFPAQGLHPGLLHCRQISYHLSHQEAPVNLNIAVKVKSSLLFVCLFVCFLIPQLVAPELLHEEARAGEAQLTAQRPGAHTVQGAWRSPTQLGVGIGGARKGGGPDAWSPRKRERSAT